jgi:hypothetical protein
MESIAQRGLPLAAALTAPQAHSTTQPPWNQRQSASLALLESTAQSGPYYPMATATLGSFVQRAVESLHHLMQIVCQAHPARQAQLFPIHAHQESSV